jgi:hypothetical protein
MGMGLSDDSFDEFPTFNKKKKHQSNLKKEKEKEKEKENSYSSV